MTYAMHTLKAPSNLVYLSDCIERAILRSVLFNIYSCAMHGSLSMYMYLATLVLQVLLEIMYVYVGMCNALPGTLII